MSIRTAAGKLARLTAINAAGGAGFCDYDLGEQRQPRFQLFPDMNGDVLAGRIFQAWNLVEIMMVQGLPTGLKAILCPRNPSPTRGRDRKVLRWRFHFETMAMQPAAHLMVFRQKWKQVRRFELKVFSKLHI